MGRILDSLAVSALVFAAMLAALLYAERDARLSAAMALISAACAFVLISFVLEKTPRFSFHRRRTRAARQVKALIYDEAEAAHRAVYALLARRYPLSAPRWEGGLLFFTHMEFDAAALHVAQKLRVSPDDLLKVWREQGAGRDIRALVVAVPGRSESDIRVLASRLTAPEVVILDRPQLVRLTRRCADDKAPSGTVRSPHMLKALRGYVTRRRARRYFAYAALLTGYYILTGRMFYLISALPLAYIACFCLTEKREPPRLIESVSPARPDGCANPRAPHGRSQSGCQ